MNKNPEDFIALAEITIQASLSQVWDALVNPEIIKQYMFGTTVTCDWKPGSKITWAGEWQGKSYEDHGQILAIEPPKLLSYSHFSPLTGLEDTPANYHHVSIRLTELQGDVNVQLEQDNNATAEARDHSQKNWQGMLEMLKKYLEG